MDSAPVPISQSSHDRLIVAHAVLGSLAALVTAPLTVVFIIVTFALGNAALKNSNEVGGGLPY